MKKALLILLSLVLALAAAAYVVSWFWAGDEVTGAAAQLWPAGLGTLATLPDRYPPQQENDAARKLETLAGSVAENETIAAYVRKEIARGDLTIAEPPAIADLTAIRDLLLREPIVWKRDISIQHGGLLLKTKMYQSLTYALAASALARARRQDPGAWDDLHALWNLSKSLDGQPPRIPRLVAMSMTRAINAVAWKMPLPAPAWLREVQDHDFVRPLFETLQYEMWYAQRNELFPLKPFADTIDRTRTLTIDLSRVTTCEFHAHTPEMLDLDITWQRAFRYRAEREATANALRARAGEPIEQASQCSDGTWSFEGNTLRFAKPIALPERRDTSMPLTLQLSP